jgi:hypothetical protein
MPSGSASTVNACRVAQWTRDSGKRFQRRASSAGSGEGSRREDTWTCSPEIRTRFSARRHDVEWDRGEQTAFGARRIRHWEGSSPAHFSNVTIYDDGESYRRIDRRDALVCAGLTPVKTVIGGGVEGKSASRRVRRVLLWQRRCPAYERPTFRSRVKRRSMACIGTRRRSRRRLRDRDARMASVVSLRVGVPIRGNEVSIRCTTPERVGHGGFTIRLAHKLANGTMFRKSGARLGTDLKFFPPLIPWYVNGRSNFVSPLVCEWMMGYRMFWSLLNEPETP